MSHPPLATTSRQGTPPVSLRGDYFLTLGLAIFDLGNETDMMAAVWMMMAAVGLLIGLGLYVYFGARAEAELLRVRKTGQ